jgi:TP901 family phage tail tape measure protein
MAERKVRVTLVAEASNYIAGMEQAAKKTRETGTESEKAAQKLQSTSLVMNAVGTAAIAVGALAATGVAMAVSKFAEFDQAMSEVQASTHETEANMGLLRDAAIEAGASTVFSATEAANAINELAKAGISTADIMNGGLTGALDLASAGGLDVARAAEIAATAMTQFGKAGSEVPHIADLLAAGAGKAQGSVEDLAQALNQGGLVASQTGVSIEETTGTLAAFAAAGLTGSDAGTSFKSMLQRLTPQSAEAQAAMDELGISAYDAGGEFIGMSKFAGVLQNALKDKTTEERNSALATIFGSDAVRAAGVLYAQGAEGISSWTDRVDDSGYAAETARLKLDNLKGDVEKLGGAFDTALIQSGGAANGALRAITQTLTGVIDGFSALPAPVQGAALGVVALTAGVGLLGGGFLIAAPKIIAAKAALADLDLTVGKVGKGVGRAALAAGGLAAISGAVASFGAEVSLSADEIAKLDNVAKTGGLKALNAEFTDTMSGAKGVGETLRTEFSGDYFQSFSANMRPLGGAIKGLTLGLVDLNAQSDKNRAKFKELGQNLASLSGTDFPAAQKQFGEYVKAAGGGEEATKNLLKAMPEYKAALVSTLTEQGRAATGQEILNLALGKGPAATQAARDAEAEHIGTLSDMAGQAMDTQSAVEGLSDELRNFGQTTYDVIEAEAAFFEATDAATKAVGAEGFTAGLNQSTEAGRTNMGQLLDIGRATNDFAAATYDSTGSVDDLNAKLVEGHKRLYDTARAFGASETEAENYANQLIATPEQVKTRVNLEGAAAAQAAIDALTVARTFTLRVALQGFQSAVNTISQWKADGRATGGAIYGPGSGTSDTAGLYALSNGEHVLTADEVKRMGGQQGVYAFREQLKGPGVRRYAEGGAVQYAPSAPAFSAPVASTFSLDGSPMTLMVDGQPIRGIVRQEISGASAVAARSGRAGVRPIG